MPKASTILKSLAKYPEQYNAANLQRMLTRVVARQQDEKTKTMLAVRQILAYAAHKGLVLSLDTPYEKCGCNVGAILEEADPGLIERNGDKALYCAVSEDNIDKVRYLLDVLNVQPSYKTVERAMHVYLMRDEEHQVPGTEPDPEPPVVFATIMHALPEEDLLEDAEELIPNELFSPHAEVYHGKRAVEIVKVLMHEGEPYIRKKVLLLSIGRAKSAYMAKFLIDSGVPIKDIDLKLWMIGGMLDEAAGPVLEQMLQAGAQVTQRLLDDSMFYNAKVVLKYARAPVRVRWSAVIEALRNYSEEQKPYLLELMDLITDPMTQDEELMLREYGDAIPETLVEHMISHSRWSILRRVWVQAVVHVS